MNWPEPVLIHHPYCLILKISTVLQGYSTNKAKSS